MGTRTLVILRHAKAADPVGTADVNRPLTKRGQRDAVVAGEWLTSAGYPPDAVLCSPARRTRETWHGVATALVRAPEVSYVDSLYAAGGPELVQAIGAVDPQAQTVLLIGHNPALSELSALLDPAQADPEGLSTAGIAIHSWDGAWSDCGTAPAKLVAAHTPRAL